MAKSRPPRRVSLHPFLTLLLIPALVSAAVSASDPLAAVAESPSLPRELRARLRASSVELASAGLAPLVDADAPRLDDATTMNATTPTTARATTDPYLLFLDEPGDDEDGAHGDVSPARCHG